MQLSALNKLVSEGLANGEVKPLPLTVFLRTNVEEAFRFLAGGTLYCGAECLVKGVVL